MGKRTGQLAGLAALGALGYMLSQDKKGAPVESRTASPNIASAARAAEEDYPDESRRGRMATRPEDMAPARAVAPGPRAVRAVAPVVVPGAADVMENYVPRDRYTRGMDEMPVSTDAANISDAVSRRTGVALNSAAGAGRGMQGGPTAAELAAYAASRPAPARVGTGSGRGGQGGPTAAALRSYDRIPRDAGAGRGIYGPGGVEEGLAEEYARQQMNAGRGRQSAPIPAGAIYKKGGAVKKMASGGVTVSSASKRADGIAQRGKTRGKLY